jgi:hypothetical protein
VVLQQEIVHCFFKDVFLVEAKKGWLPLCSADNGKFTKET